MPTYVFLSPHLDDAVLSCGATIHRLAQDPENRVIILTVMAGDPPDPPPDSPLIRELHARWDVGEDASAARRAEDQAAAQSLGAQAIHMEYLDCVYRVSTEGKALYPDGDDDIFGELHPQDPARALLDEKLPIEGRITRLYAPLGVGHHVDHQLVRDWGRRLAKTMPVYFYEDYPYGADDTAIERARDAFDDETLIPLSEHVTEVDFEAKFQALSSYKSQISTFWTDEAQMRDHLRDYMRNKDGQLVERANKMTDQTNETSTAEQTDALKQAQTQLTELIQAAREGSIIPVRLPGQLEAVEALLQQAEQDRQKERQEAANKTMSGDAEEAIKDTAVFMKTAIHELRTPMTSIRGYSDMLGNPGMTGELNDMQNQLLTVVRSNAKRMEGLLSDMSYINKIRANILQISEKMDAFKNIAQKAEKEAKPIAEELNRQLEFDIPSGLPYLTTDGDAIAHAMLKLIENGLRYSAEGEGKVTVKGRGEGKTLVIEIADNGVGMSEEELANLGTLFYRADNDLVLSYKGSGLGVPIAYGLIKMLGGTVSVESTPNEGTTFTIKFEGMA